MEPALFYVNFLLVALCVGVTSNPYFPSSSSPNPKPNSYTAQEPPGYYPPIEPIPGYPSSKASPHVPPASPDFSYYNPPSQDYAVPPRNVVSGHSPYSPTAKPAPAGSPGYYVQGNSPDYFTSPPSPADYISSSPAYYNTDISPYYSTPDESSDYFAPPVFYVSETAADSSSNPSYSDIYDNQQPSPQPLYGNYGQQVSQDNYYYSPGDSSALYGAGPSSSSSENYVSKPSPDYNTPKASLPYYNSEISPNHYSPGYYSPVVSPDNITPPPAPNYISDSFPDYYTPEDPADNYNPTSYDYADYYSPSPTDYFSSPPSEYFSPDYYVPGDSPYTPIPKPPSHYKVPAASPSYNPENQPYYSSPESSPSYSPDYFSPLDPPAYFDPPQAFPDSYNPSYAEYNSHPPSYGNHAPQVNPGNYISESSPDSFGSPYNDYYSVPGNYYSPDSPQFYSSPPSPLYYDGLPTDDDYVPPSSDYFGQSPSDYLTPPPADYFEESSSDYSPPSYYVPILPQDHSNVPVPASYNSPPQESPMQPDYYTDYNPPPFPEYYNEQPAYDDYVPEMSPVVYLPDETPTKVTPQYYNAPTSPVHYIHETSSGYSPYEEPYHYENPYESPEFFVDAPIVMGSIIDPGLPDGAYTAYVKGPVCTPSDAIRHPKTIQEVVQIVKEAIQRRTTVKALGNVHSTTDIICTGGIPVSMREFQSIKVNPDHTVTVGPGIYLHTVSEFLHKNGRAFRTMPAYSNLTIGGCIGTGAHGSTIKYNSTISDQVVSLKVVDGLGNIKVITAQDDLRAWCIHVGLLGIVIEITLSTIPLYKVRAFNYIADENFLINGTVIKTARETDLVAVHWFPSFQRCVVQTWTFVNVNTSGNAWSYDHATPTTESFSSSAANLIDAMQRMNQTAGYALFELSSMHTMVQDMPDTVPIYTEDGVNVKNPAVGYADRMLTPPVCYSTGDVQCLWLHPPDNRLTFMNIEISIPLIHLPEFCVTAKDILYKYPAAFPLQGIIMRFSGNSNNYLSTAYGRDVANVEFFMMTRRNSYIHPSLGLGAYQVILQTLVKKYSGRSHWGKSGLYYHSEEILRTKLSPEARTAFLAKMNQFDPKGIFMNDFGKRLKGIGTHIDEDPETIHCALLDNCVCGRDSDCALGQHCSTIQGYPDYPACLSKEYVDAVHSYHPTHSY